MTQPLFPEIEIVYSDPLPNPCRWPYFIVAYWPRGGYWSIKRPMQDESAESDGMKRGIAELQLAGWKHVTVMRLPADGPWKIGA